MGRAAKVQSFFESAMTDFTEQLHIDNLIAERAIRPFTVHRKNAQSFGSEDGVQETCLFFTLCETCKNFGINF